MKKELSKTNSTRSLAVIGVKNEVYFSENTGIIDLAKADYEATIKQIASLLGKYIKLSGMTFEADQIKFISINIPLKFPRLSLQELDYLLGMGIMGQYGELYARVRIDTVLGVSGWIAKYYEEKAKARRLKGNAGDNQTDHDKVNKELMERLRIIKKRKENEPKEPN